MLDVCRMSFGVGVAVAVSEVAVGVEEGLVVGVELAVGVGEEPEPTTEIVVEAVALRLVVSKTVNVMLYHPSS